MSHLAELRDRLSRQVDDLSMEKLVRGTVAMIVEEILQKEVYEHAAVHYDEAVVKYTRHEGRDYVNYTAPCTKSVSWAGGGFDDHWQSSSQGPYPYLMQRSYELTGSTLPDRPKWQSDMEAALREVNGHIDDHYEKLETQLTRQVSERKRIADAVSQQAASDGLRIPQLARIEKELAPKLTMISLAEADRRVASGEPVSKVAADTRNSIVDGIRKFGTALEEATPALVTTMIQQGEEQMRELLLVGLRMQYDGAVTAESHVRNGKTDLLVRWHDMSLFIAELKIYRVPSDVVKAINQLFGYIPIRNNHATLVWFIKDKTTNSKLAEKNIKQELQNHDLYQGPVSGKNDEYEFYRDSRRLQTIHLTVVTIIIDSP